MNKYGLLRVETTLSQTRPFNVYRRLEGRPDSPLRWRRMRKGVADIHRRAEVSRQSNHRYLDALARVEETTPVRKRTDRLCRRVQWNSQAVRAINPFHPEDRPLPQAVSDGKVTINGFCNRNLRQILYGVDSSDSTLTRRRSAQVTRKLRLLRAHGLLRKKPGTLRYDLTPKGRQIPTPLLTWIKINLKQINEIAA